MSVDQCMHGNPTNRCDLCRMWRARERYTGATPSPRPGGGRSDGFGGGETKQDVLDDICDLLGIARQSVARGSSLPSDVFEAAARRVGVAVGSMPEICEAIVLKAGHRYSPEFDSRATISGGGSTVTLEGARAMRRALRSLL